MCECQNACHVTAYSVQSSLSSLSKDGVSQLLDNVYYIKHKYETAVDYKYRMIPKYVQVSDPQIHCSKAAIQNGL